MMLLSRETDRSKVEYGGRLANIASVPVAHLICPLHD